MANFGHARNGLSGLRRRLDQLDASQLPLADVHASGQMKALLVLRRTLARYNGANVSSRSASITYYGFLSLFPILITVGNLLPVFGLKYASIAAYLDQLVPASILKWLNPIIQNLLSGASGGVLSVGAIATLWAATVGINELKRGYNSIYEVKPQRNFLVGRVVGMLVIIMVVAALALVMLAFTFGTQFLDWLVPLLGLDTGWISAFNTLKWPVALVAMFAAIVLINFFMPSVRLHFLTILPGSVFTVITWMALAQLFSLYMRYFGTRYSSYGTLGSIMVLLLWLNFSVSLLLLGAVLNAEVAEYHYGEAKERVGIVERVRDHIDD
ncbi:YihY/virulence factor BrkB family protein [Lacticaseibacillus hulanensis]|uniref:YihY/virulence factor BrkB family protein n=1 Tax=Lacticaseibacillus hulanensis TaxID=2493111 RepID=UPI000FD9E02B|nr:YihY/virulence factor BrkB family protein [Lacticaseibacillus hulanensis]